MAPVKYKIYSLYADKSANLLMQNGASYFRRINQSYSNCRVCMCKLFAGLHNIVNINSLHYVYIIVIDGLVIARLATTAALWVRILSALKNQIRATSGCNALFPTKNNGKIQNIQLVEIETG